jgi:hypothetical protein
MAINYTTTPVTLSELCDSVRGQVERERELAMMGKEIPEEECVTFTAQSMLSLLERLEFLSEMTKRQAAMFAQIETIFGWVFTQLGVDTEALVLDEDED